MSKDSGTLPKVALGILAIVAIVMLVSAGYLSYEYYGKPRCEACGMIVTEEMKEKFLITDSQGNLAYACCSGCLFRLLDPVRGYEQLHIETYCDWYGPDYKIVIDAKEHGNSVSVSPDSARVLLGAKIVKSCANNRIAYDETAVSMLLEHGYSEHTMSYQQNTLPDGTPVVEIPKAATSLASEMGIAYIPPSPWLIVGIVVIGIVILGGSFAAYKKLIPK